MGMTLKQKIYLLWQMLTYDFPLSQTVSPFIGGGIGFSITESWIDYYYYGNYGYSGKETELDLVWNIGVGLAIQANEKVNLDFSIRHVNLGKIADTKLETNEFLAGIRFNF